MDERYESNSIPAGRLKKQARNPNTEGIHDIPLLDSAEG